MEIITGNFHANRSRRQQGSRAISKQGLSGGSVLRQVSGRCDRLTDCRATRQHVSLPCHPQHVIVGGMALPIGER
jgi:hypothetical protein